MKSFKYFSCSSINIFVYWRNSQWKLKDIIKTKQKLGFCNVKILDNLDTWEPACGIIFNYSQLKVIWYDIGNVIFLRLWSLIVFSLSTPEGFPDLIYFSVPFITTTQNVESRWFFENVLWRGRRATGPVLWESAGFWVQVMVHLNNGEKSRMATKWGRRDRDPDFLESQWSHVTVGKIRWHSRNCFCWHSYLYLHCLGVCGRLWFDQYCDVQIIGTYWTKPLACHLALQ